MDRDRVKASIPGMGKRIHFLGIITEEHEGLQNTLCVLEVLWTWIFKKQNQIWVVMAHALETEAGGSPWVWSQLGLEFKFQGSQVYTEKPCLENNNNKTPKSRTPKCSYTSDPPACSSQVLGLWACTTLPYPAPSMSGLTRIDFYQSNMESAFCGGAGPNRLLEDSHRCWREKTFRVSYGKCFIIQVWVGWYI